MKFMFIKRGPLSNPDGISQFIFSVSDALIRLGHEVICLTSFDNNLVTVRQNFDFSRYPEMEALHEQIPLRYASALAARLWVSRGKAIVNRHKPDFIVLNGGLPLRFSQPSALLVHDIEARKLFGSNIGRIVFKAITYRLVNQLIVTCPELVEPVAQDSLCKANQFIVIPTCIDTKRYKPVSLDRRRPVILHCGFPDYKQPLVTLKAFTCMQFQEAKLVMVGKFGPDIEAEIKNLPSQVRARIDLPGIVSMETLKELLTTSRVMSVPSQYNIPVASPTVLEALASHTPPIVSPSISKIIVKEGHNCFVERTVEGIAKRFDELMTSDKIWSTLSQGCAETKLQFDSLIVAREYEELARKL
jgi:glycosyltransferase involved in cell wall biosynthesis